MSANRPTAVAIAVALLMLLLPAFANAQLLLAYEGAGPYRLPKEWTFCGDQQVSHNEEERTFGLGDAVPATFELQVNPGSGQPCERRFVRVIDKLERPAAGNFKVRWDPDRPRSFALELPAKMRSEYSVWLRQPERKVPARSVGCNSEGCQWEVDLPAAMVDAFISDRVKTKLVWSWTGLSSSRVSFQLYSSAGEPLETEGEVEAFNWRLPNGHMRTVVRRAELGSDVVFLEAASAGPPVIANDSRQSSQSNGLWDGQTATIQVLETGDETPELRYVDHSAAGDTVRLPLGVWSCRPPADRVSVPGTHYPRAKLVELVRATSKPESADDCTSATETVILVERPVTLAADIAQVALGVSDERPGTLDIYVDSPALSGDERLRKDTTLELAGVGHDPGTWVGDCTGNVCIYRVSGVLADVSTLRPTLVVESRRISSGPALTRLRAADRLPLGAQRVPDVRRWVLEDEQTGMPFEIGSPKPGDTVTRAIDGWFAPLIRPGDYTCGRSRARCRILRSADDGSTHLQIRYQGRGRALLDRGGTFELRGDHPLGRDELVRRRNDRLEPAPAVVTIAPEQCRLRVEQLTTARAKLHEATVLFRVQELEGPCTLTGLQATVTLDKVVVTPPPRVEVWDDTGILALRFGVLPDGPKRYALELRSGADGPVVGRGDLDVEAAPVFSAPTLHVDVTAGRDPGGELHDRTTAKELAVGRRNQLTFGGSAALEPWTLATRDPRYPPPPLRGAPQPGVLMVQPPLPVSDKLVVRALLSGPARTLLRPGRGAGELGGEGGKRPLQAGWTEVPTELTAAPYRLGFDLGTRLSIHCDRRVIRAGETVAVRSSYFTRCWLAIDFRTSGEAGNSTEAERNLAGLEAFLQRHGEQVLVFKGGLLSDGKVVLAAFQPERVTIGRAMLPAWIHPGEIRIPLDLTNHGALTVEDYDVVQLIVDHDRTRLADHPAFAKESRFVAYARRAPEYSALAHLSDSGSGWRGYGTVGAVASPLRWPHSGTGATRSAEVEGLESASVGLALLFVWEPWNFDRNRPVALLGAPVFMSGVATNIAFKGSDDLSRPTFSIVHGLGFRTGLATKTNDALSESVLMLFIWHEMMFGAGPEGSSFHNGLLFGLNITIGSLGT